MTRVALLATTPGAISVVNGELLAARLDRQLASLGARIVIVARPALAGPLRDLDRRVILSDDVDSDLAALAELAAHSVADGIPLVICAADLLTPDSALRGVLGDSIPRVGALVGPDDVGEPVRIERGRVVGVGTSFHDVDEPNAGLRGLVRVGEPFCADFITVLERLRSDGVPRLAPEADAIGLAALGLARAGESVTAYQVRGLPYRRVDSDEDAAQAWAYSSSVDEKALRYKLARKEHDDLFATFFVLPLAPRVMLLAKKLKFTPTGVTWVSILVALVAAGLFAWATRPALIVGAVLLYVSFLLDCVDGELARYTQKFSRFGGWLDMIADRFKEFLVYAGLAVGAVAAGHVNAWWPAIVALMMLSCRHMVDTWYGTMRDHDVLRRATTPFTQAADPFRVGEKPAEPEEGLAKAGGALGKAATDFGARKGSLKYWFKRTAAFPVGDRWFVLGAAAAIWDGQVALAVFLVCATGSALYIMAGRVLQSFSVKAPVFEVADKSTHRDDGPIVRLLALIRMTGASPLLSLGGVLVVLLAGVLTTPWTAGAAPWTVVAAFAVMLTLAFTARHAHDGALDWLVPAGMRAAEYLFILFVGRTYGVPLPLVFAVLGVLAVYHYDLAARIDKAASPLSIRWAGLGWDGRALLLTIGALTGLVPLFMWILLVGIGAVFVVGSVTGTLGQRRKPANT